MALRERKKSREKMKKDKKEEDNRYIANKEIERE